jgi:hypothetical protein
VKFGKLELNPAVNPGVLDTETWDAARAWEQLSRADFDWTVLTRTVAEGPALSTSSPLRVWPGSVAHGTDGAWGLASLPDGQSVFCCVGQQAATSLPGRTIGEKSVTANLKLTAFATDASNIDSFCRELLPEKGPRMLGATPRLGIGTRMTTQVWPGIFDAMTRREMAANSIQNSVRELSLLDDLLAARPAETNYSTGIGQIQMGWTGSTYEGLWVAGVLAARARPSSALTIHQLQG